MLIHAAEPTADGWRRRCAGSGGGYERHAVGGACGLLGSGVGGRVGIRSELAQAQRAQVVPSYVVHPLEHEVEIVVDGEVAARQAVAASRRERDDELRGALRLGAPALGKLPAQ